ncbi:MAG TPA: NAD-dependent succinate-semialdehyde dehydrogenase [Candidatus Acidoferrum sp.]|nr:NAD-dependent succinate-semialdehyde dehydrogenase [Candidatus Acidoferrum sp.]
MSATAAHDYETELIVGGRRIAASDGERIEVIDPASGEVFADVASGSVQDGIAAVDAADAAAAKWARTAPRERAEILRKAWEIMLAREREIAELIVRENGKTLRDALAETRYAAEFFRWYAEEAVRAAGTVMTAPSGANRILVTHQPIGISVLVTPWNFPAAMATRKIGPALAAGCTCILKPASETPLTALLVAQILEHAGVPAGVVNVLPSKRSGAVVSAILHDPRVRKLSFTGSTEVGRRLLKESADQIISSSMELGGNAPFVVFDDADLDLAIEGAMVAKMRNGGEACTAANRFYIEKRIAPAFARRFSETMAKLRVGPGLEDGVDLGPLVNEPGREKVEELVAGALGDGARLLTGGQRPARPGYFYPPTVIADVAPTSAILHEEIFGPVAPIVEFDGFDDAVRVANRTEYGLVAYVYTRDLAKGLACAEAIDAGMIGLNRGLVSDPAAPFGGTKQSGLGREGGHEGLLEFLESKYIATNW